MDANPAELAPAAAVLEAAGIGVTSVDKAGFSAARSHLSDFDAILLSDIPADDLTQDGAAAVEKYVREGGGLLMAGGPGSFAAGGYYKTQVEEALPVYMDPQRQPVVNAVVLILDKSWSMGDTAGASGTKIDLIKEATIATVAGLKDTDYLAIISFDSASHLIRPMEKLGDEKQKVIDAVASLGSFGLTDWYAAMSIAADMLEPLRQVNKNVVLLSDGRPSAGPRDYRGIITEKLVKDSIKFSAVGCGKDANEALLRELVNIGKGRYYLIQDEKAVPQIKFENKKDDAGHAELLVVELPMKAQKAYVDRSLKDIRFDQAPELLGYNRVRAKDLAKVDLVISAKAEPLLARWHYGAGRSVAFTSDLKGRWAGKWIANWSAGYGQTLVRSVLWTLSRIDDYRITIQPRPDAVQVTLQVRDPSVLGKKGPSGRLLSPAESGGTGMSGPFASVPIAFERQGLDTFQAQIASAATPYLLQVGNDVSSFKVLACQSEPFLPAGELRLGTADMARLQQLAQSTGGTCLGLQEYVTSGLAFAKTRVRQRFDLGPWLLLAAGCLLYVEMIVKRSAAIARLLGRGDTSRSHLAQAQTFTTGRSA